MTRRLVLIGRTFIPGTSTFHMIVANDSLWHPRADPNAGDEPYIDGDEIRKQREESKEGNI